MQHNDEYELIAHSHLADCSMFLVDLYYRPLHLHKELEVILVLQGTGEVTGEHSRLSVSTGDILLFESGEAHELNGGEEGLRLLAIQISRNFCKRYCPQLRNIHFQQSCIDHTYPPETRSSLRETMLRAFASFLDRSLADTFFCMSYVNQIFAQLLTLIPYEILDQPDLAELTRRKERIRRILLYLEEHFREPVRLGDLAKMEHISETHISHFFRDQLHITFQEYLSRLRVEAAMNMLTTTDLSLTNIAYECGFSDPKYLNQGFHKLLGVSPLQWRKENMRPYLTLQQNSGYTMQRIYSQEESRDLLQNYFAKA